MTRWRRRSDVLWRTAPSYVVVAAVDGRTVEVDGSGDAAWALLEDWTTEEALVTMLASRFDADEATIAADLGPLLMRLYEAGCVDQDG